MSIYKNLVLDEERALYGIEDSEVISCKFVGPQDGESALKETKRLIIKDCDFLLRYPMWHLDTARIDNINMTETCRAALWYDKDIYISNSKLGGIKALRECNNVQLENCEINSTEFGWKCNNIKIHNIKMQSEYPFLFSKNLCFENLNMKGKYSFQYTNNVTIKNSYLDTKDAFWHAKDVLVEDSVVKGEYLSWYSQNVKFVRCKIIGTQPLCYCRNLILEDCELIDTDLSFEKSEVYANINSNIVSVKNPIEGYINAISIGEIIIDNKTNCKIKTLK